MWYSLIKKILFQLPEEKAHHLTLLLIQRAAALKILPLLLSRPQPCPVTVMGIDFPNPLGLAAGMDKDGRYLSGLAELGFGFIEIGTVTPKPQPGNPTPRLFRIPESLAIINRMGFNNLGVDALVRQLEQHPFSGVLGINIGKNKDTPLHEAHRDYHCAFERVYPYAQYIVVNVSSPNTQGLRELQSIHWLQELLTPLKDCQIRLSSVHKKNVPLVVKLAPDLADEELHAIAQVLINLGVDAIIATNTTISRAGVRNSRHALEVGGLSGAPLQPLAAAKLRVLYEAVAGRIPLMGVGGIMNAADACERWRAGADLLQIYTGLIYEGPDLIARIVNALAAEVKQLAE